MNHGTAREHGDVFPLFVPRNPGSSTSSPLSATVHRNLHAMDFELPLCLGAFTVTALWQHSSADELALISALDAVALGLVAAAAIWGAWAWRRQRELVVRLTDSERRFRTLFEQSPDAVLLFDAERGVFSDCNAAALSLLRCEKKWLLGKTPWDIAPSHQPDGRTSKESALDIVAQLKRLDSHRFEWRHSRGDGTDFPAEISETALVINGVKTFLAVVRDITERKKAEAELLELNAALEQRVTARTSELAATNQQLRVAEDDLKRALQQEKELHQLKTNFVSMVSHEFRTPMGVIMSSSQLLQRHLNRLPEQERNELLDSITSSVRRMTELMEEVLVLSRVEASDAALKPEPVDLAALCHSLTDELLSATRHRCPIELQFSAANEAVADKGLLRHILGNLVSNAVKYSTAGELVKLRVAQENEFAVFTVEDHGLGIPAADQPRLFQAFYRAENVGNVPGTGLGLTIVKRCVELHGGEISFRSVENQGTTFLVRLPVFGPSKRTEVAV